MTTDISIWLKGLGKYDGQIEPPYSDVPGPPGPEGPQGPQGDQGPPGQDAPPAPISGGGAALMVASPTSLAIVKERADLVCTGVDDLVQIQAELDELAAAGGGDLVIAPGTYTGATGLRWEPTNGLLTLRAFGATINYTGAGRMFDLRRANPVGQTDVGAEIWGGRWVGTASATDGFFVSDINGTEFHYVHAREFTNAYAWSIWNQSNWTENTLLDKCQSANNMGAVNFTPASISLGTGTESFARTKIYSLRIAGTGAGPMINCRGSVYASEIMNTYGNVSASPVIFHCQGGMSGTVFFHADFEQSAYTLFEWGASFTGNPLTLIGPFNLRTGAVFETGTRPACHGYNLPVTGQGGYVNSFPGGGITLRAPNGQYYQLTVANGATQVTVTAV